MLLPVALMATAIRCQRHLVFNNRGQPVACFPANATVSGKFCPKINFWAGHAAAGWTDGDDLDAGIFCLGREHRQMLAGMSIVATMDITNPKR